MSRRLFLKSVLASMIGLYSVGAVAHAQETIKIGHYGSLTGSEATFGLSTSNGVKMAIAEINAEGGINGKLIELIEYDTKGDTGEASTVVTRMISSDKVVGVIGEVSSSISLAGAPICQKAGVPMISPSSTNPKVTLVGDYIFRVCFTDPFQGYVGATFAREDLKAGTAAILVAQNSAYSVGLAEYFTTDFEKAGGKVLTVQSYNPGDEDFTQRLTAIRSTGAEVIYIPGYYTDAAKIAVQARKLGITTPLVGGDGWDSEELVKNAGKAIEGSYFTNHIAPDSPIEILQDFRARYKDEYGGQPDALAALGYDAAKVMLSALKTTGGEGGAKLRDAIAATHDFQGATGKIAFNATRDAVKPAVVLTIKDGQLVEARSVQPPEEKK
jgi:branched-chain amino acid transport system substrate-binding protein